MTSQEAKEILLRRRAGTADDGDPEIIEALAVARLDGELGRWLDGHNAAQAAVRRALAAITVPRNLKAEILAAERRRRHRESRRLWLSAAAAAVVAAGASAWWLQPPRRPSFAGYRRQMVRRILKNYRMDMVSANVSGIRQFLRDHDGFADFRLPGRLASAQGIGCALLRYHNQPVSLVCLDGKKQGNLYLFVAERDALAGSPAESAPYMEVVSTLATASWASGDKSYLLAADGGEGALRAWLADAAR